MVGNVCDASGGDLPRQSDPRRSRTCCSDGDGFHEPFSIVERTVSDSQMKERQPNNKPPKNQQKIK